MKKLKYLLPLAAAFSTAAWANSEADEIDPADITRTNTTAAISVSNQGSVKFNGSIAFTLDNGHQAMTYLEATMDQEGDYKDSRLQYFHVIGTNSARMPRVAGSLDLIDNSMATTLAVGAVNMITTSNPNLFFFFRGAALFGQYDDNFLGGTGADDSIFGGMGMARVVWKPGADGSYLSLYPEYTYMGGDVDVSVMKTTFLAGTPLSADGTRWGEFKLEDIHTDIDGAVNGEIDDTIAWFMYKVFF